MARPSKLTEEQCQRIRMLHGEGVSAPQLSKRFKMSESSIYKILNGTYIAAPAGTSSALPPLVEPEVHGATPSLFTKRQPSGTKESGLQNQQASSRVRNAAAAGQPIDELTLAAAELIVAQARYAQMSKHST